VPKRAGSGGYQLRIVDPGRRGRRVFSSANVTVSALPRRVASPGGRPSENAGPWRSPGTEPVTRSARVEVLPTDRRLTLVLGMLSKDHEDDRAILVNMKLKDASISAIDAAQLLADRCFCPSQEAVALDRVLHVIDELDDVIRALDAPGRQPHSGRKQSIRHSAGRPVAHRRVFVPEGRSSIFRTTDPSVDADRTIRGTALKAEDADLFLAELIGRPEDGPASLTSVCRSATRLLGMSGSSVVLMGADTFPSVASAYGVSVTVQDLELTLGEGPAIDAFAEGKAVLVDDIGLFSSRWPQFTREVTHAGIRSLYALPLQMGAIKLGVLVLYRDQPGVLDGEALSAALLVADLVTNQVLDMQAGAVSESLAWGIEIDDYRAVVHQATGMISAQVDCGIGDALLRLRGRAFAIDRPIDEVATDVVTGKVRFDEPEPSQGP
jgi:GAF domain-containing protein